MKYIIKNSDLFLNGKVYHEGEIISLDDESAKFLKLYLIEVKPEIQVQSPVPEISIIKKNKRSKK